MTFQLNIDKFLNTFWRHEVAEGVALYSAPASFRSDIDHPVVRLELTSLYREATPEQAKDYAQAIIEAAFIMQQIEAQYPEIASRYEFQTKKRAMRRERRKVAEPQPRKSPQVTVERARELLKTVKANNGELADGWNNRYYDVLLRVDGKWERCWRIDSWDNKLEVSVVNGWRREDISQKGFCQALSCRKIGDVKVVRNDYKRVENENIDRKVEVKF